MPSQIAVAQRILRRSQRLRSPSSPHNLNGMLPSPSSSYDPDRPLSQLEIGHLSFNELTAGETGNPISSQQLLPQTQVSINFAESLSENISHVDSVLSSNPVPPRDTPSTNQTPPIGTGSPSYTHYGNDALAAGNVGDDGDDGRFPPPTFDMSIVRHVILTKVKLRNQHHWAYDMIGA